MGSTETAMQVPKMKLGDTPPPRPFLKGLTCPRHQRQIAPSVAGELVAQVGVQLNLNFDSMQLSLLQKQYC